MLGYRVDKKQTCAALSISMQSRIALARIASNSVYTCSVSVATILTLLTLINVCGGGRLRTIHHSNTETRKKPNNTFSLRNKLEILS